LRLTDARIIPLKAHRFDQVDRHPEAGAQTKYRANIAGDFGLVERNSHPAAHNRRSDEGQV